ncbi:low-affinity glucose transporter HXT3 [Penicillium alfredii]|uniref:Low-affinity glucose transporter HXT3 n=1 Tax=Penicillium alfredii TaxID=1506179 RepID=A0A9W9G981_9EURO|nr:low-affinity glucose transporter HXT3 [Penicillium alfredii]KAJ5114289.1 low-affinity glucose transporter HXT3 [Penicillium alfredii]
MAFTEKHVLGEELGQTQSIFRQGFSPSRCLKIQGRAMTYPIFGFAGCAITFFGYDTAVMSQVNEDYMLRMGVTSGCGRNAAAIGGLVSLWFGGFAIDGLVGALLVGYIADPIGRLKTIQLGCLWGVVGAALLASAQNMTWLAFARVISAMGCGHLNTTVPVWTSELADPHLRGAFVAVQFTLAMVGSATTYWMEFGCLKTQSVAFAWRFPLGFQIIFPLFILAAAPFYPESPRHLAKTGDLEGARSVLERCRLETNEQAIETEMEEIVSAIRAEPTSTSHSFYSMLFTKDKLHTRRRVILGPGVQVMQKLTGIDFIAVSAPNMFALSGFKGDNPALLAGGNWFGYIASLALSIYLCDRVGRRKLMLTGGLLMCIVLIVGGVLSQETIMHSNNDPALATEFGSGVATILYIYSFIYGSTPRRAILLTFFSILVGSIQPRSSLWASRSKGAALATFAFSIAGGTIIMIIPYLIDAIGFWVFILYILFALINLALVAPIYLFYVGQYCLYLQIAYCVYSQHTQTANRPLAQLDILFSSDSYLSWRVERNFIQMNITSVFTVSYSSRT